MIPSAIQRARCATALGLLAVVINPAAWEGEGRKMAEKIERIRGMCGEQLLAHGRLSARGEKRFKVIADKFDFYLRSEQTQERTAACVVAICHLIVDCRCSCKEFAKGLDWYNLDRMTAKLCGEVIKSFPTAEDEGVRLYEEWMDELDQELKEMAA